MILFLQTDVEKLAHEKHGGEAGVQLAKQAREVAKQKRHDTKMRPINARRDALTNALQAQGMELRADSRLCQGYIAGTLDEPWEIYEIVAMCIEMKWLYEETPYADELEHDVEQLARDIYKHEECSHGQAYQIAREECEPLIREGILRRFPVPDGYPRD
jgi:hypothetical protein